MPSWPALRGKVLAFRRREGVPCSSWSSKSEIPVNAKKVPAPRGLHWKKSSIMKILSNPIYTGTHSAGKALGQITQTHPSIISKALFEKAQSMKKIKMTYSPKNLKREYLFRGMVACHKCGFNLFGRCKPCPGSAGTGERALRVSVDAALRAGIFKASGSIDPMGFWDERER